MFYLILCLLMSFSLNSNADSSCKLRRLYGDNYLEGRKKITTPEGIVRQRLTENKHYLYLKSLKNPGVAELAEIKALEKGLNDRHAHLVGLRAADTLNPSQKLELFAYDRTNGNAEAGRLAVKNSSQTKVENARYRALLASGGDFRAAYLAELDANGRLKTGEKAELKALTSTYGDKNYAEIKRAQAEGKTLTPCQQEIIGHVDGLLKSPTHQEAKQDRLPAIVDGPAENVL